MPAMVTLTAVEGNLKGKEYVFREPSKYFVGRAAACRVHLPAHEDHATISRFHCVLDIDPPRIRVRDLGSLNGTYVNRHRIESATLEDDDEVQIGKYRLTFLLR